MKFVCDRCQTRYSIADDKVRGKILKVRCKSCQNVITVREAGLAGAEAAGPQVNEERTVMAPAPTAAEPFAQPAARDSGVMPAVRGHAPPPAPPPRDDVQWYMALDGNRTGPFSRKALVDKLAALPADADLHIWNEKLDGWKEPGDVPAIARDLQARRRPPVPPMPGAGLHTGPHPVPGAARRTTTGSQPVIPLAAAAPASPRKTSHSLPAPSGAVGPAGAVEPPLAAAPTHAPAAGGAAQRGRKAANGVALNGNGDHGPALVSDDAAPALGMPGEQPWTEGAPPAGDVPVVPPEGAATAGNDVVRPANWQAGSVPVVTAQPRNRSAKLMLASLGIVAVIVVLVISFLNKKPPPAPVEPAKTAAPADNSFTQLADKLAQQGAENPPAVEPVKPEASKSETTATVRPTAPVKGGGRQPKGKNKKGLGRGGAVSPTAPPPVGATAAPAPGSEPTPAPTYMGGERPVQLHAGGGAKSAPTQGDITRVINNNKNGIKICYQRALLKDSSLTHGKISVHVSLGLSGKVKNVGIDGPTSFLSLQPCIKDLVSRWAFPPSSEPYETEFSYVFQGNE